MIVYSVIRYTPHGSRSSYQPGNQWIASYDDDETAMSKAGLYNMRAVVGSGVEYFVIAHDEREDIAPLLEDMRLVRTGRHPG